MFIETFFFFYGRGAALAYTQNYWNQKQKWQLVFLREIVILKGNTTFFITTAWFIPSAHSLHLQPGYWASGPVPEQREFVRDHFNLSRYILCLGNMFDAWRDTLHSCLLKQWMNSPGGWFQLSEYTAT